MKITRNENETMTDFATRYLREETMSFKILPSSSIKESEISKELGISRAPVREALNRLISEELVVFKPGKGFFCRQLSLEEVQDLFDVREDLELASLKSAIVRASDDELQKLLLDTMKSKRVQSSINMDTLVLADEEFHLHLNKLGKNNERVKFLMNINKRIRFVRQISLLREDRRNSFMDDHIKLVESILERDEKKAIDCLKKHLGNNTERLRMNISDGLVSIYGMD
ncbi:MAG: GntR family transcriptional regulator [Tissierellia bacterium]|nr:GntR family transcriptional regulator [Tissierellia bacterium]